MKSTLIVAVKLATFLMLFFSAACTDKNESFFPSPEPEDALLGKTIKYTLQLVSAANNGEQIFSLYEARVFLAMNDSVYIKKADSSGMLSFGNLADGVINVRIEHPLFYTYNYTISLKASDSVEFETVNYRNAASLVRMLPKIDVTGTQVDIFLRAQLDATNSTWEIVPEATGVVAFLSDSVQRSLASPSEHSTVLDAWLEMPGFYAQSNSLGQLSLFLPVAANGLMFDFEPENFFANYTDIAGFTDFRLFSAANQQKWLFPQLNPVLVFYYLPE